MFKLRLALISALIVGLLYGCNLTQSRQARAQPQTAESSYIDNYNCLKNSATKVVSFSHTPPRSVLSEYQVVSVDHLLGMLTNARRAWNQKQDQYGGNYKYTRHKQSWTGLSLETEVVFEAGQATSKRTQSFGSSQHPTISAQTVTDSAGLSSNQNGFAAQSYRGLLNSCNSEIQKLLNQQSPAQLMLCLDRDIVVSCSPVDLRITDDNPYGYTLSNLSM